VRSVRARRSRTPSRRRVSSDRRALTGHDYRLAAVAIIDDLRSDTSEPLSAIDQILHDFGENCRPMVEQFFAEIARNRIRRGALRLGQVCR
jgi:hypothetical protein